MHGHLNVKVLMVKIYCSPALGGARYFQAPALDMVGACFYLDDIPGKHMSGSLMKLLCTNKRLVHWSHIIKYPAGALAGITPPKWQRLRYFHCRDVFSSCTCSTLPQRGVHLKEFVADVKQAVAGRRLLPQDRRLAATWRRMLKRQWWLRSGGLACTICHPCAGEIRTQLQTSEFFVVSLF